MDLEKGFKENLGVDMCGASLRSLSTMKIKYKHDKEKILELELP